MGSSTVDVNMATEFPSSLPLPPPSPQPLPLPLPLLLPLPMPFSECGEALNTGDLEAQHLHSNWLSKVKHTLREFHREDENKLGFHILKVPGYYRHPPLDFTPVGWRFGLHNRENLHSSGSEAVKISVPMKLGLVGPMWDSFCNAVVDDPKSMFVCYGLEEEATTLSDEEIKYVLALDALLLAVHYDQNIPEIENPLWAAKVVASVPEDFWSISRYKSWRGLIGCDTFKTENQIPFEIIQRALEYLYKPIPFVDDGDHLASDGNDQPVNPRYLQQWMWQAVEDGIGAFMDISQIKSEDGNEYPLAKCKHILEALYEAMCGPKGDSPEENMGTCNSSEENSNIPSATKLLASGIEIVGVAGPLCTLSYKNECLSIPKMAMYDETVSFIRNMAWFEEYYIHMGCMFHNYIFLLVDLIQTPQDLKILVECGVIRNGIGVTAFKEWNSLEQGITQVSSSAKHQDMIAAINKRCKFKRYRLWSEFVTLFCSKPWLVLSAITIVVVTLATLLQTYVSIIGSNRMRPQFP